MVIDVLKDIGQEHLQAFFGDLTERQKGSFLRQADKIDINIFHKQKSLLLAPKVSVPLQSEPFLDYDSVSGYLDNTLIADGKVGCIVVAGGQGTRLGLDAPKGMFPVTVAKHKSLYQLFAEKVCAAGIQAGRRLLLAVMTSPSNHSETVHFFESNNFFGLFPGQVSFFVQDTLPYLDDDGNMFLENRWTIAEGSDGNGGVFERFCASGIWSEWYDSGVRDVIVVNVDNPLADPFDSELLGYHHHHGGEATLKCFVRGDARENVGVVAKVGGKTHIIEYTELSHEDRDARSLNGHLRYACANMGMYCFTMDFISKKRYMPLHLARKKVTMLDGNSMAWKFEKFIFDVLEYAETVKVLIYPRERCFAPLKNAEGPCSIETVRKALQERDCAVFTEISGNKPPEKRKFELSQQFYYPTKELLNYWHGRELPDNDYIDDMVR